MSEYRPKTEEKDRRQMFQWVQEICGVGPEVDTQRNVLTDLYNAEAVIRERDAEIERLRWLVASLVKAGDAAIKGDYSDWDTLKPQENHDEVEGRTLSDAVAKARGSYDPPTPLRRY